VIEAGKAYPVTEFQRLLTEADAERLKLRGYVLQFSPLEGTISVVHWTQSDMYARSGLGVDQQSGTDPGWVPVRKGSSVETAPGRRWRSEQVLEDLRQDIPPIVKRTPQQRIESLVQRFVDDCVKHGTVPGLSDPMIQTIVGEAWRSGTTQITGDHVRRVAQYFLEDALAKQRRADYKKVVSTPGVDRVPEVKTA